MPREIGDELFDAQAVTATSLIKRHYTTGNPHCDSCDEPSNPLYSVPGMPALLCPRCFRNVQKAFAQILALQATGAN